MDPVDCRLRLSHLGEEHDRTCRRQNQDCRAWRAPLLRSRSRPWDPAQLTRQLQVLRPGPGRNHPQRRGQRPRKQPCKVTGGGFKGSL